MLGLYKKERNRNWNYILGCLIEEKKNNRKVKKNLSFNLVVYKWKEKKKCIKWHKYSY